MWLEGLIGLLAWVGRHGRWSLIAGLVAGMTLPGVAAVVRVWLPVLIFALLLVSAYRIGHAATVGTKRDAGIGVIRVLALQLAAPLVAIAVLWSIGWLDTLFGIACVLTLAAPSISGAPNFAIMMGKDPTRAMRLLILGTALFPLTVIPIFLALPAIPTLGEVVQGALKLLLVIALAVAGGFMLRRETKLTPHETQALDGAAALLLGVLVVGLMAAMGPALVEEPGRLLMWLAFACALNFCLQLLAFRLDPTRNAGAAIVAGNRNIALFLVALPPDLTDALLLFIGCYQIPMYLTPIVMARLMRSGA
ncbi:MAG: hypothetical protein ACU0GG_03140 [Paracoccaceae bacterium]